MVKELQTNSTTVSRPTHPTIASIAAHIGLSRATVTHVLNGRAKDQRISSETQQRVLKAAHEVGYRANVSARAVRAGRFGNIALIQSLHGNYLPNELLHGLTKATAARDIRFVLTEMPDDVIDDAAYLPHTMQELAADGVLINQHVGVSQAFLNRIHRLGIPAVFLNVKQEFDCVHPDDRMGGQMAAEFLLRLGHERIAYMDTDEAEDKHYSQEDRREGYEQAMQSAGRMPQLCLLPKNWQMPGQSGADARVEAAQRLLSQENRPTAIVAYELTEAMAVVHAAHRLGIHIPRDLSLIQFHHWIDDRCFLPIQTVCNAMAEVGAEAVAMLLSKIENPQAAMPTRVIPVTMLEGATCMSPRTRT